MPHPIARHLTSLALATALLAASALAQPPVEPKPPAQPAAAEAKKVCRREGPATGSMMGGKRVCHTAAEWKTLDAQIDQTGVDALDHARQSRSGMN